METQTARRLIVSNAIRVIFPYKHQGVWMFDDAAVGLQQEPFVSGAPEIIEVMTSQMQIKDAAKGFALYFSDSPFPQYQVKLDRVREEYGGNWYRVGEMEGWLCPALFKYFAEAPAHIYCRAEAVERKP